MNPALWLRFARRDLRSGLQGFWIFLTCLALGTAAIAIIGSLSAAIERGLDEQGQPLLGLNASLHVIQCNEAFCNNFELVQRQLLGKSIYEASLPAAVRRRQINPRRCNARRAWQR